jgi:enoyl-CoA hydratase
VIAACDIRVCAVDAKFSLREVRMGMISDLGGIQRLPFIVGESNTRLLALTGMDLDAGRALSMGLVSEVLVDRAQTLTAARKIASAIAANPPRVVEGTKQVMNARIQPEVSAGLNHALVRNTSLMQSGDFSEAVTAFMEKRPPVFHGT